MRKRHGSAHPHTEAMFLPEAQPVSVRPTTPTTGQAQDGHPGLLVGGSSTDISRRYSEESSLRTGTASVQFSPDAMVEHPPQPTESSLERAARGRTPEQDDQTDPFLGGLPADISRRNSEDSNVKTEVMAQEPLRRTRSAGL